MAPACSAGPVTLVSTQGCHLAPPRWRWCHSADATMLCQCSSTPYNCILNVMAIPEKKCYGCGCQKFMIQVPNYLSIVPIGPLVPLLIGICGKHLQFRQPLVVEQLIIKSCSCLLKAYFVCGHYGVFSSNIVCYRLVIQMQWRPAMHEMYQAEGLFSGGVSLSLIKGHPHKSTHAQQNPVVQCLE